MSKEKEKTIQDIIFDIHKRKSEYLFGYDMEDESFHHIEENCQECLKKGDRKCPYSHRDDSSQSVKNPVQFVQCYMRYNKGFLNYLKNNDFIVAAPLFRVQTIENESISYKDNYWYPFRSESAYLDIPPITSELKETIDSSEDALINDLRWEITTQRDSNKTANEIPFSIFKKVEKTKFSEDKKLKYLDVSDAYASFMMIYYIIAQRNSAIKGNHRENDWESKFNEKVKWEFSNLNEPLIDYIKKTDHNLLKLSISEDKVYRESTWNEDLQLLGFFDANHIPTNKLTLFKKWLFQDIGVNNGMIQYKNNLKDSIKDFDVLRIGRKSHYKVSLESDIKKSFVLHPPIHLIVRAFWQTPVRWVFIPMTPKIDGKEVISVSGIILMIKDEEDTGSYLTHESDNLILQKVKNLLPILTTIYSIEKQSLEDFINKERLDLYTKQKETSFRNAIAKVFLRTLSHNIGSHVLSRMVTSEDLGLEHLLVGNSPHAEASLSEQYLGLHQGDKVHSMTVHQEVNEKLEKEIRKNKDEEKNRDAILRGIQNDLYKEYLSIFNSYVKTRMEFLADFVTGPPQLQVTKFLVNDVVKSFDKNKYLLNRISGLSKDFKFDFDVILPKGVKDVRISTFNDILGQHALYIILENIIRNTAKHSPPGKEEKVRFTIKVAETRLDESYYKVIVFDDVVRTTPIKYSSEQFKKNYTDKRILKWFETYKKKDQNGNVIITETQKIALELNALIDSDIIDQENFELRKGGMGMIEMLVSAAYLRGVPSGDVQNENYRLIFDNTKIDEFNNDVRNGKNSPKIFRAIAHQKKYLGFQFYLPKPKEIFIIDKNEEIKGADIKALKSKGILIEPSIVSNISRTHDVCLVDRIQEYRDNVFLPSRRISWNNLRQYYRKYHGKEFYFNPETLVLEVWRAYVSKRFQRKKLNSENDRLLNNSEYPTYKYSFSDHGENYQEINFRRHIQIYGSQNKTIVDRIKRNGDFENDNSPEREILIYKVLTSSITNILILDERIQKHSESKIFLSRTANTNSLTYHEFWNGMNVYIPQAKQEEKIDLNKKNYDRDYSEKITKLIKDQFFDHEERVCKGLDFIVIHLGVLEKILMAEFRSTQKDKHEILKKIEEFAKEAKGAKIIITSGRGQPANLPDNTPFVSYSMLSQYLVEKRFKLYLTELLYAAKPIKRTNDEE